MIRWLRLLVCELQIPAETDFNPFQREQGHRLLPVTYFHVDIGDISWLYIIHNSNQRSRLPIGFNSFEKKQ